MLRPVWLHVAAVPLWVALGQACSTSGDSDVFVANGNSETLPPSSGGASTRASVAPNGGSAVSIDLANSGGATEENRTTVACSEGEDCDCPKVSVMLLGKPGKFGDKDSTAFMDWLNSSTLGTAKVDSYPDRTKLTKELLDQYNVIILLGLGDDSDQGPFWKYDEDELAAVKEWVESNGGGIISLSGASGKSDEVTPNNQLVAFTGMAYVPGSWITPTCLNVDAANAEKCSYCCGQAAPISDFDRANAVTASLFKSVEWVGMHGGRSIDAPSDAHVAATIAANGTTYNVIVGKLAGTGRVLLFTDEWITYTSQWSSSLSDPSCTGYLPQDVYQTAQFWYNMIKWVQPKAICFKIIDVRQPVVLW